MRISLNMNGREMSFSNDQIFSKLKYLEELEKHLSFTETDLELSASYEIASTPTEGKCFWINPHDIDRTLFLEVKEDFMQEWTRKAIVKSLLEVKKYPKRYSKPFATFIPPKMWRFKSVAQLKKYASTKGDHMANWVEQSLEWAQRISDGESWETLCNLPDTSNWYRLVIWKSHYPQIVGGSSICGDMLPPTTVFGNHSELHDILHFTVPLVVLY